MNFQLRYLQVRLYKKPEKNNRFSAIPISLSGLIGRVTCSFVELFRTLQFDSVVQKLNELFVVHFLLGHLSYNRVVCYWNKMRAIVVLSAVRDRSEYRHISVS